MNETIDKIELFRWPVKLKEPFVISLGKLEFADNVIVKITTSGGIVGFGECSPFQTIHGENSDTCMAVGKVLAKALLKNNAEDISQCSLLMDAIIFGNTSIKSAFDIALYDILAKKNGMPLYKFLGGRNDREIITDYTVSFGGPAKMAEDALRILKNGFTIIKVKLGGSEEEDVLRIKMIREKVGNEIPIRIDANQGWNEDSAVKILKRLEQYNIQHCEEPVKKNKFLSLPVIKSQTKIPLMADESCFDHEDAENLIQIKACDMLNIKLGKSSGIFKAKKIIALAEKNKMNLQAGGFLESRLGFTAMAHVALSSDRFVHFDFDTPLMFCEDLISGGIKYHDGGKITVPEIVGLGAWVENEMLKTMECISIEK